MFGVWKDLSAGLDKYMEDNFARLEGGEDMILQMTLFCVETIQ